MDLDGSLLSSSPTLGMTVLSPPESMMAGTTLSAFDYFQPLSSTSVDWRSVFGIFDILGRIIRSVL